jgi:hypothetical protein
MNLDERLSFDKYSLKREARRFSANSAHPSSCESSLNIPRQLVKFLASRNSTGNKAQFFAALLLPHAVIDKGL